MSEASFRLYVQALDVWAWIPYAALLAAFLWSFLGGGRAGKILLIFCTYGLSWFLFDNTGGLVWMAALVLLAKPLALEPGRLLLLLLLFQNAKLSSGLLAGSVFSLWEGLRVLPADLPALFTQAVVSLSILLAAHGALLAALLYALWRRLRGLSFSGWELCHLALFPAAGILFGQIVASLLFEVKDGVPLQLYERHPGFMGLVPLLAMLLYAGSYLGLVLQQKITQMRREQTERFMERQQIRLFQERLRETRQLDDGLRRLRHELRGHLTAIQGLAGGGCYQELTRYIGRIDETIAAMEPSGETGNPVTDIIVERVRRDAAALSAPFQVEFRYPDTAGYEPFDVGIILQNLLQNALESCARVPEGERYLSLTGRQRGKFFLIEVKNAAAGRVPLANGLPAASEKEDGALHGTGLFNVRQEVEKYRGELELKTEERTFCATVLLQELGGVG